MKLTNLKFSAKVDRVPAANNNREHHADVICEIAELEVPVEEVVKTTEILGREFFIELVKLAINEEKNSKVRADARYLEAQNEAERLRQAKKAKAANQQ